MFLLKIILFIICAAAPTFAVDCGGEGWSYLPQTGFCYGANVQLQRYTWVGAEDYCKANGGHLATINTLEEYQQILSYAYTAWDGMYGNWIGYYTDSGTNADQTKWTSVDGTSVEIEKFGKWCSDSYPRPRGPGRRCLGIGWDRITICYYDVECNNAAIQRHRIICKRPPKSGGLPALVTASAEKYDCGTEGWSYYPPTGFCYGANIAQERRTFVDAEEYCKHNGGHIATFDSLEEYQHLLSYVFLGWDGMYGNWLGYTTESGSNSDQTKWISVDGTHVNIEKYGKWCVNTPRGNGRRCMGMGWDSIKICLYDIDCNHVHQKHKIICKRSPKLLPAKSNNPLPSISTGSVDCGGEGWSYLPQTGFCYGANVKLQRTNWPIAEDYCKANGAHLATINSLEEYRQILSYVYTAWDGLYGNWLGYYTEKGTNFDQQNWISVDGTAVEIEKYGKWCNEYRWGQQVPRVSGKRCLGIGWDQTKICFYDVDCTVGGRHGDLKVICKRPPKSEVGKPLPALVSATAEKYDCGTEGWSYYPPTGFCYGANIAQERRTWTGAEEYCKQNGGHVATFDSLEEYQHLLSYIFLAWDNVYGNWLGYYTESGTNWDPTKWISVNGKHSDGLKYGKWCNEIRYGVRLPKIQGKRCLAIGWDEIKICLYDVDCDGKDKQATMKVICKRPLKTATKGNKGIPPVMIDNKDDEISPVIINNNETLLTSSTAPRLSCLI